MWPHGCAETKYAPFDESSDEVKMRRQELAEIEAVLAAAAGVSAAVAVPLDGGISRILAAAVTPASADVDAVWVHDAVNTRRDPRPAAQPGPRAVLTPWPP